MTGRRPISVMIVDDHPLMRAGLTGEINVQDDMHVISEARDGLECVKNFRKYRPDVTLLDLRMPHMNGIEALTVIREEFPEARIIVLTTLIADAQVHRALRAGAMGYISKSLPQSELADTVRAVAAGRRRIPQEIAAEMAEHAGEEDLTDRELSVLRAVSKGCSNKIIGTELGISEHTIKNHIQNIMGKLGANDRTHAVTIAVQRGFIEL